ncbi:MAG: DUF5916 domain-containing protein [Candidatus Eremiobacteraeota bacterium]|nr:DUF5916 domain-containing protein [Candidatus Eremiobacteraeota bacterium]
MMKALRSTSIACAVFLSSLFPLSHSAALAAIAAPANTIEVGHTLAPPPIDGTFDANVWKNASHVRLGYDLRSHGPAAQATDAYVLADAKYLYVAFVAKASAEVVAQQHTNNQGDGSDDNVVVWFWPDDTSGFSYRFVSTAIGTHYQNSSENSVYEPSWDTAGKIGGGGFIVNMRIPLKIMHFNGHAAWRMQFVRNFVRTGEQYVWSGSPSQQGPADITYAGYLTGMASSASVSRSSPRIGVYGLGQSGSPSVGGTRARTGVDISYPITNTTSFVATLYPDFSNVDRDQQSISPTAFRRFINEVRPFFAQLNNSFNNFDCNSCLGDQTLYTAQIPTPRQGYAIEGKQGRFSFGAFDALGDKRSDTASAVTYQSADRHLDVGVQRVSLAQPGFSDVSNFAQSRWSNLHNFGAYLNVASDRGTNVTDPSKGQMLDFGLNLYSPNAGLFGALRKVGAQFAPADGFSTITDVAGWSLFSFKHWDFKDKPFKFFEMDAGSDGYHDSLGRLNQAEHNWSIGASTKRNVALFYNFNQGYYIIPGVLDNGGYLNQSGFHLSYLQGTATPINLSYQVGHYGNGYLRTWQRSGTVRLRKDVLFSLQGDQTIYTEAGGKVDTQWLERASLSFQLSRDSSAAIGFRKITGIEPALGFKPRYLNANNISFAYHKRSDHDELYLAYGDPSRLFTQHVALFKWIHYFGAEKGT